MTEAQDNCLKTAYERLGEHFDAFIILAMSKPTDDDSELFTSHCGGYYAALGMLTSAKQHMLSDKPKEEGEI